MIFIMKELNSLFLEKIIARLSRKIIFELIFSSKKIIWFILFIYQIKKIKDCMDLLIKINENKAYCLQIKDFNRRKCNKTKNKNKKNSFEVIVDNVLVVKEFQQSIKDLFRDKSKTKKWFN